MKRVKLVLAVGIAVLTTAALIIGGWSGKANAEQPTWGLVAGLVPPTANLTTVFMVDQNNAWVGGSNAGSGELYRLRFWNGSWQVIERQSFPQAVLALAAVTGDDVWVVGEGGLIAHRVADSGWFRVDSPVPNATLKTIQMFGAGDEGWIGGVVVTGSTGSPVMLHYKSGAWQAAVLPSSSSVYRSVNSLHFRGESGFAVGNGNIWRYDGGKWVDEQLPNAPCLGGYQLTGVRTLNQDEAWATGYLVCSGTPFTRGAIIQRASSGWQFVDGQVGENLGATFSAVSFTSDGYGLAVGGAQKQVFIPSVCYIVSYQGDGQWHYEDTPDLQGTMQSISQADAGHALAVGINGIILSYGYGPGSPVPTPTPTQVPPPEPTATPFPAPNPSDRIPDPQDPHLTYFPLVGHTLGGGFRDYWNAHGGLEQFGYPITEEFQEQSQTDGKTYTVQYFERARFEWHPENRPPYDVLLGLLGRTITLGRDNERPFRSLPPNPGKGGPLYFSNTGHFMAQEFTSYWQTHGGLPVYGYPISEAFTETSPTDGKQYLVQYFERNRLEYHPELSAPYRVSLGLLGVQVLRTRGWLP